MSAEIGEAVTFIIFLNPEHAYTKFFKCAMYLGSVYS